MVIWSILRLVILSSDHLVIWSYGNLIIWSSNHLVNMVILSSDYLVIWSCGHLVNMVIWSFGQYGHLFNSNILKDHTILMEHLSQQWIICALSDSCFGDLIEQSGYLVVITNCVLFFFFVEGYVCDVHGIQSNCNGGIFSRWVQMALMGPNGYKKVQMCLNESKLA